MTTNIWQQITVDPAPTSLGIWATLGERPGGLWGILEGETLVIENRHRGDVWHELNDETLIIRPQRNLWQVLAQTPPAAQNDLGIWTLIGDVTLVAAPPEVSLWSAAAQAGDVSLRKPVRRLGWALKALQTATGETYFVLKNTRSGAYLRLNKEQVFLWNLMDGEHSLRDLAVAYFAEFRALAPEGLLEFLGQLEANGFLVERRGDLFQQTARSLGQGRLRRGWQSLVSALTQTTFSLRNLDALLTRLYAGGVFLLYTPVAQILIALVTLTGLGAFGFHAFSGTFSLVRSAGGQLSLGLLGLYLAQFGAILLHEAAHAFTVKHYGRQVRRAGLMLYLGMPAFFVDTSDIWMEPRRPRLLVSWAGPYSGFFLGGLSSLLIYLVPSPGWDGWLFQFAFTCILLSFVNLNPLLRWDGYYLLMDWLEMPMLRDRALEFIRRGLWKKRSKGESFSRNDTIYSIFGILSLLWTVIAVAILLGTAIGLV